jgi:hypothetical protein
MLHVLMVLLSVYAIAWFVSTPESRAAAAPMVDRWSKRALMVALGFVALLWLASEIGPDPPTDPPPTGGESKPP